MADKVNRNVPTLDSRRIKDLSILSLFILLIFLYLFLNVYLFLAYLLAYLFIYVFGESVYTLTLNNILNINLFYYIFLLKKACTAA